MGMLVRTTHNVCRQIQSRPLAKHPVAGLGPLWFRELDFAKTVAPIHRLQHQRPLLFEQYHAKIGDDFGTFLTGKISSRFLKEAPLSS
jgi:hypothetical protein